MNSFNNVFGTVEMNTRVEFDEKTLVIKDTFLRKDTYGITSMLPNQNISVWMAPLPTEIPRTHEHIIIPSLLFSPPTLGIFHTTQMPQKVQPPIHTTPD